MNSLDQDNAARKPDVLMPLRSSAPTVDAGGLAGVKIPASGDIGINHALKQSLQIINKQIFALLLAVTIYRKRLPARA